MTDESLTDATYLGFIQALCWTTGADGNNPTTFNEPDNIWVDDRYLPWDRQKFLTLFAEFDEGSPVMLLKPLEGPAWVLYSTESDDCPDYTEWDELGLKFAAEWADNN